jgi:dolichol-phosphate mannosyltransferase
MSGQIWLILPTYNEAGNITQIVSAVTGALEQCAPEGFKVCIVDDNSPDGTGKIADKLAKEDTRVEVIHRAGKAGLGQAYVAGFERALVNDAGYVIEMDADFSHDPEHLPVLIDAVRGGADLALGSRYINGGDIENWGLLRRIISRGGCTYARILLGVDTRDLTGGFKCFAAETLRTIDYQSVRAQGYGFQVELTYRALKAGLKVVEVPITFRERRAGQSKMSARITLEAALMVPTLRWGRREED